MNWECKMKMNRLCKKHEKQAQNDKKLKKSMDKMSTNRKQENV